MQNRKPNGRLGELLIESGHLQARELEKALEIQRVAGGHLGTNLLEMGTIDEDTLLEAVGRLHENPTVAGHRLADIPKEVSSKVPRDLIRRHSIVPFALHGNTVYIASQRPGDIHIENEVTLATSRLTRTFVGLEVRVQEALHRYHGHALPLRFSRLTAKLNGQPLAPSGASDRPTAPSSGFALEAERADSSEWISGSSQGTSPSFTTAVRNDAGTEDGQSASSAERAPQQSADSISPRPDIFRALDRAPSEGFDPTLSSTVGRRIVWKDFEVDEVEEPSPSNRATSETAKASTDAPAAPDVMAIDPSSATETSQPVPASTQEPTTEAAAGLSLPGHSTIQSLLENSEPSDTKGPNAAGQFPSAVRGTRQRKSRETVDLKVLGKQEPGARAPKVESEVLDAVSSPERTSSTATLEDAHAALLEATNREAVGRILMQGFRPFFKRRVLLAKRGDQIRGWRADGPGVRPRVLSNLSFLVGDGTPFLSIQSGSRFWLSAYHQDRAFGAMSTVLGPVRAPDCMILPLKAGDFIVGFLYGDNEHGTVTGQPLNEFLALSDAAGAAFERIIRRLRETDAKSASAKTKKASGQRSEATETDPWDQSAKPQGHAS